ncbi:hypothetical protein AG1IA_05470 [Rhizoctonia solani AG-1 IA]|uniref:Uncharacterized protein n=1 Tax=Thanatephorus cucumeris (strain AG1-IA) TaxID=983506 RepID=L8WR73_THACA|nr:hypothetical protein AG1IA_05470 [Rhizoctonia solani AG-1 IA]
MPRQFGDRGVDFSKPFPVLSDMGEQRRALVFPSHSLSTTYAL